MTTGQPATKLSTKVVSSKYQLLKDKTRGPPQLNQSTQMNQPPQLNQPPRLNQMMAAPPNQLNKPHRLIQIMAAPQNQLNPKMTTGMTQKAAIQMNLIDTDTSVEFLLNNSLDISMALIP